MEWLSDIGLLGLFIGNFLAATILPFSSDALYIGALMVSSDWFACFAVATMGNWLGSVVTYWMGRIERYGVWAALVVWVPFIGDVIALALGFYRTRPTWTFLLLLIGKAGRFLVWTLMIGL